jgi:hypothetical protein
VTSGAQTTLTAVTTLLGTLPERPDERPRRSPPQPHTVHHRRHQCQYFSAIAPCSQRPLQPSPRGCNARQRQQISRQRTPSCSAATGSREETHRRPTATTAPTCRPLTTPAYTKSPIDAPARVR